MTEREKMLVDLLKRAPRFPSTCVDDIMIFRREYAVWLKSTRAAIARATGEDKK